MERSLNAWESYVNDRHIEDDDELRADKQSEGGTLSGWGRVLVIGVRTIGNCPLLHNWCLAHRDG